MADIAATSTDRDGQELSETAVSATDTITGGQKNRTFVTVTNGSGGVCTVTVYGYVDDKEVEMLTFDVPNGEQWIWGPITSDYLNADDKLKLGFSATSSVTVAGWTLPVN